MVLLDWGSSLRFDSGLAFSPRQMTKGAFLRKEEEVSPESSNRRSCQKISVIMLYPCTAFQFLLHC